MQGCKFCQDRLPSHCQETMITKPRPDRAFQEIAADFAQYTGLHYLNVVDCHTDWLEIIQMKKNTTSQALIRATQHLFRRNAAPDVFWSDGGPQLTSHALRSFLLSWGTEQRISSPHCPQSNGKAEATVKSMKKLNAAAWSGRSLDEEKLALSLLQYGNTPTKRDGLSPAQKLYGHPVQDSLPAHRRSFDNK